MKTNRRQFLKLLGATGLAARATAFAVIPKEVKREIVEYELPKGIGFMSDFLIDLEETVAWDQSVDNNIRIVQTLGGEPRRVRGQIEEEMRIYLSADSEMIGFLSDKFGKCNKITVVSDRLGIKRNGKVKEMSIEAQHAWGRGIEQQGAITHVEVNVVLQLFAVRT